DLHLTAVNVADVAHRAVDALQLTTTQRINLTIQDESLIVLADALRLEQVLHNLLTNATKYAPGADHIDMRVRRQGDDAEVAVQDYGPGMEQADLSRLFTRFYQTDRLDNATHGGLGLGLFIAREIMRTHGGDVDVTSALGVGSTFAVHLPLRADDAAASEDAGE
ncbi:MAG TPA: ATP-binding protein, partial [Ktedonobacterales bacterium]